MTKFNTLRATLLGAVAATAFAPSAHAATVIFPKGKTVTPDVPEVQEENDTTQIQLDNSAVVSVVGAARYRVRLNRVIVERGSFTVLSESGNEVVFDFGDGRTVTVNGSGVVEFDGQSIFANVFSGRIVAISGGRTVTYRTGSRFRIVGTGAPSSVIANRAVTTVGVQDLNDGLSAVALNGLPISLGEALEALGANADIIAAARGVDLRIEDSRLAALPAGDLEALIAFQSSLASYVGADGTLFAGSNPELINLYLRYLATGGQIEAFQTAYLSILSSYLEILRTAGLPSSFTTIALADIETYLAYLESVGLFGSLTAVQQEIIAEYLAFIRAGGVPDEFFFSNAEISAELQAQFSSVLASYLLFIREGGVAGDFTDVDITLIQRYINSLQVNGVLGAFFTELEAQVLIDYLAFLADGGSPNDFTGFASLPIGPILAASYASSVTAFLDFINGGNLPSDFEGLTQAQFVLFVNELERSGLLGSLLEGQRAALLSYVAFLQGGGTFDGIISLPFFVGTDVQIAQIDAFVTFIRNGGDPADFDGLSSDFILLYLQALDASGLLTSNFGDAASVLRSYITFLANGGVPSQFTGFADLTIGSTLAATYATALNSFILFVQDGGDPTAFEGLTEAQFLLYVRELERAGFLTTLLPDLRAALLSYVSFIQGGGSFATIGSLPGFVTVDTQVATIQAFLLFVRNGGDPAAFAGVNADILRVYLATLQSSGLLAANFATELDVLVSYLTFLQEGGDPADFDGFSVLPIGETLAVSYVTAVQAFLTFIENGGVPSQFEGLTEAQFLLFVEELERSGFLANLLSTQRTVLLQYVTFLRTGGTFDGIIQLPGFVSDTVQISAIQSFLIFLRNGGTIGDYTAVSQAVLVEYLQALDAAGQLEGVVTTQELTILRRYVTFVTGGGAPSVFDGFDVLPIGPALIQDYVNALRSFVIFIRSGGVPSQFSGLTAEQLVQFVNDLDEAEALASNFDAADLEFLRNYAEFVAGGGSLDAFDGLPALDVTLIASINSDAVVNFSPDFVKVTGVYRVLGSDFGRVSGTGEATIGDQNELTQLRTRSGAVSLDLTGSTLVALGGDDDILMARFEGGSIDVGGQSVGLGSSAALDIIAVANPAEILPTTGTANYSLSQTLGVQVSNGYSGPTSVDMDLSIRFGASPTFTLDGTFSADRVYGFNTDNGQIVGGTLTANAGFNSGQGQFCSQLSNCSVFFEGNLTESLDQIGASFNSTSDAATFAGVGILERTDTATASSEQSAESKSWSTPVMERFDAPTSLPGTLGSVTFDTEMGRMDVETLMRLYPQLTRDMMTR